MFSDSDSDIELDSDEEDLHKLGDGLSVHEKYLAYLVKPKEMNIILYQHGHLGDVDHEWMALAPEWKMAIGSGSTQEKASKDFQSKLVFTKLPFIEERMWLALSRFP